MTDIANFFHTIYSHSLPWAVLGKQHVKDVLEPPINKADKVALDQHWSSQVDKAIQRGNSRETFGIPVGPDTSRMISRASTPIRALRPFCRREMGIGLLTTFSLASTTKPRRADAGIALTPSREIAILSIRLPLHSARDRGSLRRRDWARASVAADADITSADVP
jgi:hypothetical protein